MLIDNAEFHEVTGTWDYSTLGERVRIGRDCFIER